MRVKLLTYLNPTSERWSDAKQWLDDNNSHAWLAINLPFPCPEGTVVDVDSEIDLQKYKTLDDLRALGLEHGSFIVIGALAT